MKHWATANVVKIIAYTTTVNSYNIISTKKKKMPMKHDSQGYNQIYRKKLTGKYS